MIIPNHRFNPHRLLKSELIWLMTNYCRHGHTYLAHPQCFFREEPDNAPVIEKVGFLDIETTGLEDAHYGYVLSYCIKELDGGLLGRTLTPKEIKTRIFDLRLLKQLCKDIRKFDRIIVYWGKDYRFDIPYIRTRALKHKIDFPKYKELIVNDLYDIVKSKLKLRRNSLQNACYLLGVPCKEHPIVPDIWQGALTGYKPSLDYIFTHNKEDVASTEAVWKRLQEYVRSYKTSI